MSDVLTAIIKIGVQRLFRNLELEGANCHAPSCFIICNISITTITPALITQVSKLMVNG